MTVASNARKFDPATGEELVWSIHDNAWVTVSYWEWVNGR